MKFEYISIDQQKKYLQQNIHREYMPKATMENILNYINDINSSFDLPKRSSGYSAGYDFKLSMDILIPSQTTVIIPTFIKVQLDKDKMLNLYPRSSYGIKKNLMIANTIGVIDSDYYNNPDNEGHIMIAYRNMGKAKIQLKQGDKFAQGIIQQFFLVDGDEYGKGDKRLGGIGSSGK